MSTAELIYQEARELPEADAQEVLDFVVFLKAKRALAPPIHRGRDAEVDRRKADLLTLFSQFQVDMTGFKFDREEANARH